MMGIDDDGGDDPSIRELDLDDLASRTPANLLWSSQHSTAQDDISSDPVTALGSRYTREGERGT